MGEEKENDPYKVSYTWTYKTQCILYWNLSAWYQSPLIWILWCVFIYRMINLIHICVCVKQMLLEWLTSPDVVVPHRIRWISIQMFIYNIMSKITWIKWNHCYIMDPCERQEIFSYDLSGSPLVEKYWFPNWIVHRIPIEPAQSGCDGYMITLYVLFQLYSQFPYYKLIGPISLLSPVE